MKAHNLDADTPLIPEYVADTLTQDRAEIEYLCDRARLHYSSNAPFRKRMRSAKCREWLACFMGHWLESARKRGVLAPAVKAGDGFSYPAEWDFN